MRDGEVEDGEVRLAGVAVLPVFSGARSGHSRSLSQNQAAARSGIHLRKGRATEYALILEFVLPLKLRLFLQAARLTDQGIAFFQFAGSFGTSRMRLRVRVVRSS